jgi:hypothetical protein
LLTSCSARTQGGSGQPGGQFSATEAAHSLAAETGPALAASALAAPALGAPALAAPVLAAPVVWAEEEDSTIGLYGSKKIYAQNRKSCIC